MVIVVRAAAPLANPPSPSAHAQAASTPAHAPTRSDLPDDLRCCAGIARRAGGCPPPPGNPTAHASNAPDHDEPRAELVGWPTVNPWLKRVIDPIVRLLPIQTVCRLLYRRRGEEIPILFCIDIEPDE